MEEVLKYIVLFAIHAAAVTALFAVLLVNAHIGWIMRSVTVALGAVAMGLPVYAVYDTLGHPNPWPEPGRYTVRAWKFDEPRRVIYVFVQEGEATRPYHYSVPFNLKTALALQEAWRNPGHVAAIHMEVAPFDPGTTPPVNFEFEMRTVIRNPMDVRASSEWDQAREEQLRQEAADEAAFEAGEEVDQK